MAFILSVLDQCVNHQTPVKSRLRPVFITVLSKVSATVLSSLKTGQVLRFPDQADLTAGDTITTIRKIPTSVFESADPSSVHTANARPNELPTSQLKEIGIPAISLSVAEADFGRIGKGSFNFRANFKGFKPDRRA